MGTRRQENMKRTSKAFFLEVYSIAITSSPPPPPPQNHSTEQREEAAARCSVELSDSPTLWQWWSRANLIGVQWRPGGWSDGWPMARGGGGFYTQETGHWTQLARSRCRSFVRPWKSTCHTSFCFIQSDEESGQRPMMGVFLSGASTFCSIDFSLTSTLVLYLFLQL